MVSYRPLLVFLLFLLSTPEGYVRDSIIISNAWIAEAPPGSPVSAAYLDIENPRTGPVKLVSIASKAFDRIEIHRTQTIDGIASMKRLDTLVIPAADTVSLCPGNRHLMLFEPVRPLKRGDRVRLAFIFTDGSVVHDDIPVTPRQARTCGY